MPYRDFAGRRGAGDVADSLPERDHRVGQASLRGHPPIPPGAPDDHTVG